MNQVNEIQIREGLSDWLSQHPWEWHITGRISLNVPIEEISKRAHDFLHRLESETVHQIVGIGLGLAARESAHSHCHILMASYRQGQTLIDIDQDERDRLASLWTNGSRSAFNDCKIKPIYAMPGVCNYISSPWNFVVDEASPSGKQCHFIFLGHRRLDRWMKRHISSARP